MAVARAAIRQRIFSSPIAFLNLSPINVTQARCATNVRRVNLQRWIPQDCKPFIKSDGVLTTNQTNIDFLSRYNITHDNGVVETAAHHTKDLRIMAKQFGITVRFSPKHVISPLHLSFLDPRGHPLASLWRERYATASVEKPLWLITTSSVKATKAVVRHSAKNRMRAALYEALEAQGYDKNGKGSQKSIEGTLWLHVAEPLKAASAEDKAALGKSLVYMMELQQKQSVLQEKLSEDDVDYMKRKRKRGHVSPASEREAQARDPDFRASDILKRVEPLKGAEFEERKAFRESNYAIPPPWEQQNRPDGRPPMSVKQWKRANLRAKNLWKEDQGFREKRGTWG